MQGEQPIDSHNVIRAAFTPKVVDGGKATIKARRYRLFAAEANADTAPCELPVG